MTDQEKYIVRLLSSMTDALKDPKRDAAVYIEGLAEAYSAWALETSTR